MKSEEIGADIARKMTKSDFVQHLMTDMNKAKQTWNLIMLALFVWVVIWLVLYHAETCGNTALVTMGSTVSFVFGNWVWSGHMNNRMMMGQPNYMADADAEPDGAAGQEEQYEGSQDSPIMAMEQPKLADEPAAGGQVNG